jgi:hypothetical protein
MAYAPGGMQRIRGYKARTTRGGPDGPVLPQPSAYASWGHSPDTRLGGALIYWDDHSGTVYGDTLVSGLAWLMGYESWAKPQPPKWFDRLDQVLRQR